PRRGGPLRFPRARRAAARHRGVRRRRRADDARDAPLRSARVVGRAAGGIRPGVPAMSPAPAPHVSRARSFSLIWVVPVLALLIGGWMVFREVSSRGPEITIDFADGSGLEANKTTLEYKGVTVGTVREVELKPDASGVVVHLRLERSGARLATTDAKF